LAFHSGRKADHSPLSSAKVKEWVELYLHSPNTPSWRGAQLGEHRDDLTLNDGKSLIKQNMLLLAALSQGVP
jgi:hypothetical protein